MMGGGGVQRGSVWAAVISEVADGPQGLHSILLASPCQASMSMSSPYPWASCKHTENSWPPLYLVGGWGAEVLCRMLSQVQRRSWSLEPGASFSTTLHPHSRLTVTLPKARPTRDHTGLQSPPLPRAQEFGLKQTDYVKKYHAHQNVN